MTVREDRLAALLHELRAMVTMREVHGMKREGWLISCAENATQRWGRICGKPIRRERNYNDYTTKRECFANAIHLAIQYDDLTYVEGYALDEFMAIHHAWLVRPDGRVLDPTWGYRRDAVYVGVPLHTRWVCERIDRQGVYGILSELDPREGLPDEAIAEIKDEGPVPGPEIDEEALARMTSAMESTP
jgi:hypothetical protein